MRAVLWLGLSLSAASGHAAFATHDLSATGPAMQRALGEGFVVRAEQRRVTLTCPSCTGAPMVDVTIGRQDDGTEGRVRSGETTIARLDALCRAREPECRIVAIDVGPGVGWTSTYPLGSTYGATAILLRDGDLLTIRSLASERSVAQANVDRLVPIARTIVGR